MARRLVGANAGMLLIGPLGTTKFTEILIEMYAFSLKKIYIKMSSGKWRPFCPGLNVLKCDFSSCHARCQTRLMDDVTAVQNLLRFQIFANDSMGFCILCIPLDVDPLSKALGICV